MKYVKNTAYAAMVFGLAVLTLSACGNQAKIDAAVSGFCKVEGIANPLAVTMIGQTAIIVPEVASSRSLNTALAINNSVVEPAVRKLCDQYGGMLVQKIPTPTPDKVPAAPIKTP